MSTFKTVYTTLILMMTFAYATYATYNYLNKKKKSVKKEEEIQETLLFGKNLEHIYSEYTGNKIPISMDRLLYYLYRSQFNMDVCMYMWTSTDITNAIVKLHNRGVKIRVILDADRAFNKMSSPAYIKLKSLNIPVRWMWQSASDLSKPIIMNHKFCLVDTMGKDSLATPFVMAGSLNWTDNSLWTNYEDCLVTSQKQTVEDLQKEFERLWELFKPKYDSSSSSIQLRDQRLQI